MASCSLVTGPMQARVCSWHPCSLRGHHPGMRPAITSTLTPTLLHRTVLARARNKPSDRVHSAPNYCLSAISTVLGFLGSNTAAQADDTQADYIQVADGIEATDSIQAAADIKVPDIQVPDIQVPDIQAPDIQAAADIEGGIQASDIQAAGIQAAADIQADIQAAGLQVAADIQAGIQAADIPAVLIEEPRSEIILACVLIFSTFFGAFAAFKKVQAAKVDSEEASLLEKAQKRQSEFMDSNPPPVESLEEVYDDGESEAARKPYDPREASRKRRQANPSSRIGEAIRAASTAVRQKLADPFPDEYQGGNGWDVSPSTSELKELAEKHDPKKTAAIPSVEPKASRNTSIPKPALDTRPKEATVQPTDKVTKASEPPRTKPSTSPTTQGQSDSGTETKSASSKPVSAVDKTPPVTDSRSEGKVLTPNAQKPSKPDQEEKAVPAAEDRLKVTSQAVDKISPSVPLRKSSSPKDQSEGAQGSSAPTPQPASLEKKLPVTTEKPKDSTPLVDKPNAVKEVSSSSESKAQPNMAPASRATMGSTPTKPASLAKDTPATGARLTDTTTKVESPKAVAPTSKPPERQDQASKPPVKNTSSPPKQQPPTNNTTTPAPQPSLKKVDVKPVVDATRTNSTPKQKPAPPSTPVQAVKAPPTEAVVSKVNATSTSSTPAAKQPSLGTKTPATKDTPKSADSKPVKAPASRAPYVAPKKAGRNTSTTSSSASKAVSKTSTTSPSASKAVPAPAKTPPVPSKSKTGVTPSSLDSAATEKQQKVGKTEKSASGREDGVSGVAGTGGTKQAPNQGVVGQGSSVKSGESEDISVKRNETKKTKKSSAAGGSNGSPAAKDVSPTGFQVLYYTGWETPRIRLSVQGNKWYTADMVEVDALHWKYAAELDMDGPLEGPLVEFVITDGDQHWDHPPDGGNYMLWKTGAFRLTRGEVIDA